MNRSHLPQPENRRRRFVVAGALVAVTLLAAGCTDDAGWTGAPERPLPSTRQISALRTVDDCDQLVDDARPLLQDSVDSMWSGVTDDGGDMTMSAESSSGDASSGDASAPAPSAPNTTAVTSAAPRAMAGEGFADSAQSADSSRAVEPTDEATGTNNQEVGVDEIDIVKTDGTRIVSIVNGTLRVTELDGSPSIDGTLDLSSRYASDLFLRGDQVLVVGSTMGSMYGPMSGDGFATTDVAPADAAPMMSPPLPPETQPSTVPDTTVPDTTVPDTTTSTTAPTTTVPGAPTTTAPATTTTTTTPTTTTAPTTTVAPPPVSFSDATTLTLVSLEDPTAPRITGAAEVEGSMVSAREIDDRARIVLRSQPQVMNQIMMANDAGTARRAVQSVSSEELLPRMSVDGRMAPLGDCEDVLLTAVPASNGTTGGPSGSGDMAVDSSFQSGPSTVTVISVGESLDDLQPVSVQGTAETIYASTGALYVASGSWDEGGSRTDIHRFELPADGPAAYTGSGRAPGRLLNQFPLSEDKGALRVVTTVDAPAPTDQPATTLFDPTSEEPAVMAPPSTEARLSVFETAGDTLDEIGYLDGLGVGEEVQSVRFMGDTGYVVTFRQTDPLYAIDLSDPAAPRTLGELKIPGFSEYLHPVGDGLLMGIGRDADPATGMDRGMKVSLFDVSDSAAMTEVDQIVLPGGYSDVSSDHKAFTWDAERSQAIFPVTRECGANEQCLGNQVAAAMVVRVENGELVTVGEISHSTPQGGAAPFRSVVVDADLWTLSYVGLGRSDAADPVGVELVQF